MKFSERLTILLFAVAALALGQSFTAAIRGVVSDSSQAAVPDAKITVTDVDRNVQHEAVSDNAGRYVVTALPPGRYTLEVRSRLRASPITLAAPFRCRCSSRLPWTSSCPSAPSPPQ